MPHQTVVAVHLAKNRSARPESQRVDGCSRPLGSGDDNRPAVHGRSYGGRSVVVHQRSEGATVNRGGGDEVQTSTAWWNCMGGERWSAAHRVFPHLD